jgi:hypothetical protein
MKAGKESTARASHETQHLGNGKGLVEIAESLQLPVLTLDSNVKLQTAAQRRVTHARAEIGAQTHEPHGASVKRGRIGGGTGRRSDIQQAILALAGASTCLIPSSVSSSFFTRILLDEQRPSARPPWTRAGQDDRGAHRTGSRMKCFVISSTSVGMVAEKRPTCTFDGRNLNTS